MPCAASAATAASAVVISCPAALLLGRIFGLVLGPILAMAEPVIASSAPRLRMSCRAVPPRIIGALPASRNPSLARLDKGALACAFRLPTGTPKEPTSDNAPLSQPHLRRASRERHRQRRAPFGLVPSHPRPWWRAFHRSARSLRHHPGGRRSRQSRF